MMQVRGDDLGSFLVLEKNRDLGFDASATRREKWKLSEGGGCGVYWGSFGDCVYWIS